MFVDVNLSYRGKCPNQKDIKCLEDMLNVKFTKINFIPITENPYSFQITQQGGMICLGNPNLSCADTLSCSAIDLELPVTYSWDLSLATGNHWVSCEKGNYMICSFSRPSIVSFLSFWIGKLHLFIRKHFSK